MSCNTRLRYFLQNCLFVFICLLFIVACGGGSEPVEVPTEQPLVEETTSATENGAEGEEAVEEAVEVVETAGPEEETEITTPVTEEVTPIPDPIITHTSDCTNLASVFNQNTQIADSGNGYVRNQLVLIGYQQDLETIVDSMAELDQSMIINALEFDVSSLSQTVVIYIFEADFNVIEIARNFNDSAHQLLTGDNHFAVAEPNYILSNPKQRFSDTGLELPTGAEGFPGSPGAEGAPGTAPSFALVDLNQIDIFSSQWAYNVVGKIDDSYLDVNEREIKSDPPRADLLILDSVPSPLDSQVIMDYQNQGLCIYYLFPPSASSPSASTSNTFPVNADSHGIFVASLAGSMAYEGNINLIQILKKSDTENRLQGDLVTILTTLALHQDVVGKLRQQEIVRNGGSPEDNIAHTVINMSLGFEFNPRTEPGLIESIRNSPVPIEFGQEIGINTVDMPVVPLATTLLFLEQNGYVLVAAAGNDGLETPQSPASFPYVIGVEAVSYGESNSRSCFSNRGNISAPGGGPPNIDPPGDNDPSTPLTEAELQAFATQCVVDNLIDCPTCGLTGHVWSEANQKNMLGRWAGTSFATPLVSGLALSIIEVGFAKGYNLSVDQVQSAVYCTASGQFEADNRDANSGSVGIIHKDRIEDCVKIVENQP